MTYMYGTLYPVIVRMCCISKNTGCFVYRHMYGGGGGGGGGSLIPISHINLVTSYVSNYLQGHTYIYTATQYKLDKVQVERTHFNDPIQDGDNMLIQSLKRWKVMLTERNVDLKCHTQYYML